MSWPEVEPRLEAPVPLPEPELELDLDVLEAERSLKRLVVPRMAPRLEVAPDCVDRAVLVEVEVEEAPDEEPEDAEELDEDEELDPPADEPLEDDEDPPPAEEGTEVLGELLPPPPPPPRLPRSCGAIKAANRSADTVPEIRTVRSRSPAVTATVLTASAAGRPVPSRTARNLGQSEYPAAAARTRTIASAHQPPL